MRPVHVSQRVRTPETGRLDGRTEGEDVEMGIAFLSLVILCVFVYLFYALFRPENF